MLEIFGKFIEPVEETIEYLIISFSPSSLPIQDRWRNNSLSADFLADYWGTFFPAQVNPKTRQNEMRETVSHIANELLENAMKFNCDPTGHPIRIGLYLMQDYLRFYVSNSIHPESCEVFKQCITELLTGNPDELYLRQLESNAGDWDEPVSRLGYLNMINDYQAELGWKFESIPDQPGFVDITTMAQLAICRESS